MVIEYQKAGEKYKTIEKTVKGEETWFFGEIWDDELDVQVDYQFLLITTRALAP